MLTKECSTETRNSVNFSGSFIKLELDGDIFGLDIQAMNGVIGNREMTPIPGAPAYVKGICNLMGERLPVIDMRLLLDYEASDSDQTHIIIARGVHRGRFMKIGLIVDKVTDVETLQPEFLSAESYIGTHEALAFISGTLPSSGGTICLLEVDSILSHITI